MKRAKQKQPFSRNTDMKIGKTAKVHIANGISQFIFAQQTIRAIYFIHLAAALPIRKLSGSKTMQMKNESNGECVCVWKGEGGGNMLFVWSVILMQIVWKSEQIKIENHIHQIQSAAEIMNALMAR